MQHHKFANAPTPKQQESRYTLYEVKRALSARVPLTRTQEQRVQQIVNRLHTHPHTATADVVQVLMLADGLAQRDLATPELGVLARFGLGIARVRVPFAL